MHQFADYGHCGLTQPRIIRKEGSSFPYEGYARMDIVFCQEEYVVLRQKIQFFTSFFEKLCHLV